MALMAVANSAESRLKLRALPVDVGVLRRSMPIPCSVVRSVLSIAIDLETRSFNVRENWLASVVSDSAVAVDCKRIVLACRLLNASTKLVAASAMAVGLLAESRVCTVASSKRNEDTADNNSPLLDNSTPLDEPLNSDATEAVDTAAVVANR